jgi:hypothetical protein
MMLGGSPLGAVPLGATASDEIVVVAIGTAAGTSTATATGSSIAYATGSASGLGATAGIGNYDKAAAPTFARHPHARARTKIKRSSARINTRPARARVR